MGCTYTPGLSGPLARVYLQPGLCGAQQPVLLGLHPAALAGGLQGCKECKPSRPRRTGDNPGHPATVCPGLPTVFQETKGLHPSIPEPYGLGLLPKCHCPAGATTGPGILKPRPCGTQQPVLLGHHPAALAGGLQRCKRVQTPQTPASRRQPRAPRILWGDRPAVHTPWKGVTGDMHQPWAKKLRCALVCHQSPGNGGFAPQQP